MSLIAVQYLDSAPEGATPAQARQRLAEACQRLPISLVLLGWDLPPAFEEAVAEETARQGARLFRWQPWLTGDARTDLPPEWAALNLAGEAIPGHGDSPDFTFVCPNRSGVAAFLVERVEDIAGRGFYQGIFLDRIRFPSPAPDPATHLGCFCRHCARQAADRGLDLEPARRALESLLADGAGAQRLAASLLGRAEDPAGPLEALLDFRAGSITRLVEFSARQARAAGLAIGLDCFSPALARAVGQDLGALDGACEWIKVMTYPRVLGPAGISFELLGLADWLAGRYGLGEGEALETLAAASGLPIPGSRAELRSAGLGSGSVAQEVRRGLEMGVSNLLAGIALVELPGIHESGPEELQADLQAARAAGAGGLVLSWNLWHISAEALDLVRRTWSEETR